MAAATAETTRRMLHLVSRHRDPKRLRGILDLGSGLGGSAHWLAAETGGKVTCVDICPHLNRANRRRAVRVGLDDRVTTRTQSFEELPKAWAGRFDLIWSQEALCHARSLGVVMDEAARTLRPQGLFVYSDIFLAPGADSYNAFTRVNALCRWAAVSEHRALLASAGFAILDYEDWTSHLPENFRRMRDQIQRHRSYLLKQGVSVERLDNFAASLEERLLWAPGSVLQWGVFVCISQGAGSAG